MKIEVSKQDLELALKFADATAKSGDDLSGHYLFRVAPGTEDSVEVLSSNGKAVTSVRLNCKYTPTEGGATAFMFSVARMEKWLNAVPDAALALEHANGTTTAFSPLGELKFDSFDHSQFPLFDNIRSESTLTTKVTADRLRSTLKYSRPFVYSDETKKPQLCQVQVRDSGILYATDTATALAIRLPGFEKAGFPLSLRGVGSLLTFLGSCGDGEIEIREHDRMVLFCLGDTAMFGEAPMHHQFPKIALGLDVPNQKVWKLNRKEVKQIVQYLLSAAPADNDLLIFTDTPSNSIKIGMAMSAGGTKHLPISCSEKISNSSTTLPEKGFKVRYLHLQKVLDSSDADDLVLGVNAKGAGGWLRFDEESNGDHYYSILQWSN